MISKCLRHGLVLAAMLVGGLEEGLAETLSLTVAQPVPKVSDTRRAHIAVTSGMRPIAAVPALVLPTEDPQRVLAVGSVPGIEGLSSPVQILAVIEGSDGSLQSSSRAIESPESEPVFRMGQEAIQQRIREQRLTLRRVSDSAEREEKNLRKVSEQADELLKFERVLGGDDPARDDAAGMARLAELQALAQQRLELMRQQPSPPAFKKRETELVEQLNAMSTALHARDQALREGLIGVSPELQQKLDLIKATQGEHIDLLRRELAELRREREAAEAASARAPEPPR